MGMSELVIGLSPFGVLPGCLGYGTQVYFLIYPQFGAGGPYALRLGRNAESLSSGLGRGIPSKRCPITQVCIS